MTRNDAVASDTFQHAPVMAHLDYRPASVLLRTVPVLLLLLAASLAPEAMAQSVTYAVRGTTLDAETGEPLSGVDVWLAQEGGVQRALSDTEGSFQFDARTGGAFHLVALLEGRGVGGHTGFLAGDAEIPLSLSPGESISVTVIGPTSAPLAGARLVWMNVNGNFNVPAVELAEAGFPQYRSGSDGVLKLPPLPVGGFVRLRLSQFDHADLMVDYLPVRQEQPALQMAMGIGLAGRVLSPADAGVAGAVVRVFQVGLAGQREFASAISDPEGYFRCRVPAGDYLVGVRHADFASPVPSMVALPAPEEEGLLLRLEVARHITGSVLLPDGAPCGGVYVAYRKGDTIFEEAFTGADGTFRMRVASPDGLLSIVPPEGYVTQQLAEIPVAMEEAERITLKPIQLAAMPKLSGVVLDAEGKPVARALISTPRLGNPFRIVTDADGRFDFLPSYLPSDGALYFVVEHPQRFERADFLAEFSSTQEIEVRLKTYKPSLGPLEDESEENVTPRPMVGDAAPEWKTAQWFNTDPVTVAELRGKVVVLAFWGSFDDSPQGIDLVKTMNALYEAYEEDASVAIIGMHDATSTEQEVNGFMDYAAIKYPVALDSQRFETFTDYKVTFIPDMVLLDKQGKIRYRQPGESLIEYIKILRRE